MAINTIQMSDGTVLDPNEMDLDLADGQEFIMFELIDEETGTLKVVATGSLEECTECFNNWLGDQGVGVLEVEVFSELVNHLH